MADNANFVRLVATCTHVSIEEHVTYAHYRWNTGEHSQVRIPDNFHFNPRDAVRPSSYRQSAVERKPKRE